MFTSEKYNADDTDTAMPASLLCHNAGHRGLGRPRRVARVRARVGRGGRHHGLRRERVLVMPAVVSVIMHREAAHR